MHYYRKIKCFLQIYNDEEPISFYLNFIAEAAGIMYREQPKTVIKLIFNVRLA